MKTDLKRILASLALAALTAASAHAEAPWWDKYRTKTPDTKFFDYLQKLTFGGDLRLRNDASYKRGPGLSDRNRFRYRLRFGWEAELPWYLTVNMRLGSGTGEQVSTNQSFDNLSSQKALWLDTTYLRWTPLVSQEGDGTVHLTGGRMPNPLWRLYTSDILWDDDLNPEGFAQGVEWLLPNGMIVFANSMQAVADEDSNSSRNQWIFSEQAGAEFRLPFESRLKTGIAYHNWTDTQRNSLSPAAAQDGNRRTAATTAGVLGNRFGVAEVTGQLSTWAGQLPIFLQGTAIRNVQARGLNGTAFCPAANECPTARDGYQYGAIVGQAKMPGTWEVAAFQKYVQSDATIADVADSDFGDGGTNQQGQIFWAAYAPAEWMSLKAKFFNVDVIDTQFAPNDKAVRRVQLDLVVKF